MLSRIINIGIFSIIFVNAIVLFKTPFEFYINYIPLLILLFIFFFKFKFPTKLLYIFLPLLLFGLINIFFDNNTMADFFKIYINVFIAVLFFYYVFEYYNRDTTYFFSIYMQFCIMVAILGIIQLISYKIGFRLGYHYGWLGFNKWGITPGSVLGIRINSIFSEPSYFAATLGPAFFIAFYNLVFQKNYFINRNGSILIVVTYLLTFSTVAYLGVFFTLLLLLINFGFVRYVFLIIPIVASLFYYLYQNVDEFTVRMDGINELYFNDVLKTESSDNTVDEYKKQFKPKVNVLGKIHGSSFVSYNNYIVTKKNFLSNPLFGTGLGSHGIAYQKYNLNSFIGNQYKFNTSDANSMLLRLISETGIAGILFFILFIRNFYVKRNPFNEKETIQWIVSNAVLVIILLQLARQGNYTYSGFMAFMWLYYYIGIQNEESKDVVENENIQLISDTNLTTT